MKKLLLLLLLMAGTLGAAFTQESSDEYDDFDDIFSQPAEDIEVEQSEPVITTAAADSSQSILKLSGHFDGSVGLALTIIDKPDLGGFLDLDNILYLNVKPSPVFGLHGALQTSLKNKFTLDINYLYFDYMPFNWMFISAGKKDVAWGYTRLFGNCNIMSDTNGRLNAEFRFPWSSGTATFVASYDYALLSTTPSYKDISYAASIEQTIGHTSVNLFGKLYGQSDCTDAGVRKSPIAGLEAKRTFFNGYDAYAQGYTRLADYKKLNSKQGWESVTATTGFYKLWDGFDPNLGINIEYQYNYKPNVTEEQGSVHNHEVFLQGGIKRIGKNKNMKGAVEWNHNFNTTSGYCKAGFIIDGLFPYGSWKNGIEVDYAKGSKPEFTLGTSISISLDY